MNIALWVVQALLMVGFGMAGFMKMSTPYPELNQALPYTADLPEALVRFIGTSEVAGALGVILPAVTRIRPALTPLAGAGLAIVMVLATGFHAARGEFSAMPATLVLGALAAFVAWGRWRARPIAP